MEREDYWESLIGRSVSRFFLLSALHETPMHGYQIARTIEACCDGCCRPTDGMIYPTLKELVSGGYIECVIEVVGGRTRKVCHLTDKGEEAYRDAARAWAGVLPFLQRSVEAAGVAVATGAGGTPPRECSCGRVVVTS